MNKPCASCGGTGQIGSFLGVSRFLLTWEECSACCGTGIVVGADDAEPEQPARARQKSGRGRGNRKRRR